MYWTVCCVGLSQVVLSPRAISAPAPSLWALVLDMGDGNGWTTSFLCLGRAAWRESASFPPSGGASFTCLALGNVLVGKTGCVFLWDAPLPCSLIRCSSAPWHLVHSHERWCPSYFSWVWYHTGIKQVFWEPLNFQDKSSEWTLCEYESQSLLTRFPNSSNVNHLGFPVTFTFWYNLTLQVTLTIYLILLCFHYWLDLLLFQILPSW